MRQICSEIKPMHNIVNLLEEHADDEDKQKQAIADFLSLCSRSIFYIERKKQKSDYPAIDIGRIHISG